MARYIYIYIDKRHRLYGSEIVWHCLYKQINYAITGISMSSIRQHKKPQWSVYLNCIDIMLYMYLTDSLVAILYSRMIQAYSDIEMEMRIIQSVLFKHVHVVDPSGASPCENTFNNQCKQSIRSIQVFFSFTWLRTPN